MVGVGGREFGLVKDERGGSGLVRWDGWVWGGELEVARDL